jgi:energy-coupling factor transport system ATP-binding protein
VIDVKGLRFRYSPDTDLVLRGIDLAIPTGNSVGIVGSNGSGKSTFARHLNGLIHPQDGDVLVDGMSVKDHSLIPLIRQSVGMVFQNPDNQIVATIVEDDVAFGPENLGLSRELITERVEWALGVTHLTEFRYRSPATLSGGQRQRLAIASVLAMKPAHIVFDEPTSMLDPTGRDEVLAVMDSLRDELNISIIHITHHLEELFHLDTVVALHKGEVAFSGSPLNFFKDSVLLKKLRIRKPAILTVTDHLKKAGVLPDSFIPRTAACLVDALAIHASLTEVPLKSASNEAEADISSAPMHSDRIGL